MDGNVLDCCWFIELSIPVFRQYRAARRSDGQPQHDEIEARGKFGEIRLQIRSTPSTRNPESGCIVTMSVSRRCRDFLSGDRGLITCPRTATTLEC
ncbi:DUF108 domain-containing protein [Paenibacillus sp. P26]|nr:DUF108 domain-containing protein [Paenibacillus sp. P26]UUZ91928.1 DUF108 domain-containing protein [Paenibacillus sp. P25]